MSTVLSFTPTSLNPRTTEAGTISLPYDHVYMTGYHAGMAVGRKDMADESLVRLERAIFAALTLGLCLGAVLAVLLAPTVAEWLT